MRKILFSKSQENEIIDLYKHGNSSSKISDKFNVSRDTIVRFLKTKNINIVGAKKYVSDTNFFEKIDSEEKAYWLGFLYADGYVRVRDNSYELKLKLSQRDVEHIEKFKKAIKSTNIIKLVDEKYKYSKKVKIIKSAYICIYDKKIVTDLINWGCIPKKSLKIKFPELLDKSLTRHFIRGYFDGDGCAFYKGRVKIVYFCGGSKQFLKRIMSEFGFLSNPIFSKKRKNVFRVTMNRFEDINKIRNYFYKNSNIFLDRKKTIIEKIVKENSL